MRTQHCSRNIGVSVDMAFPPVHGKESMSRALGPFALSDDVCIKHVAQHWFCDHDMRKT